MATPRSEALSYGERTGSTLPSEAEWAGIRPIFEQMYIDEHATLETVIKELRQNHHFKATKQMYKRRIREWGLGKNLKRHEVEHILGIAARRKAQGKTTAFLLRGRKVDMRCVRAFQRRHKLPTIDASAADASSGSKRCPHLRVLTPEPMDRASWATCDRSYENTLRSFGALLAGLVDSRYYRIEHGDFVMLPLVLRGEVSDVCSSLVASKTAGKLNMMTVRKLALLLESIVCSRDAWTHCRLIYALWIISTAGHATITQALLTHLHRLAVTRLDHAVAQYRFVDCYSSLEPSRAAKFAADIIMIKAELVRDLRVDDDSAAFKLRSLGYDVYWRQREQGNAGDPVKALDLWKQCQYFLGVFAVETMTMLRTVLEDGNIEPVVAVSIFPWHCLRNSLRLTFDTHRHAFTFDGHLLNTEAASEMACICCQLGHHKTEAWIFDKLWAFRSDIAFGRRGEYSLLEHIARCEALCRNPQSQAWLRRTQEIDNIWRAEVEAAANSNVHES